MSKQDELKKEAAEFAVENFIKPGMLVGLGMGSTALHAVRKLGQMIRDGLLTSITAIPCGIETEELARSLEIPLVDFKSGAPIDVTIDGADEVDPQMNLIKGGGGALTREKIVAQISRREIIVVDESKLVQTLGEQWKVPVEVIQFGWQSQMGYLESLGGVPELRKAENGAPYLTDQKNYIIDVDFGPIDNPIFLAEEIKRRAGIVEHGMFLGLATDVVVASPDGVRHIPNEA